MTTQAIWGSYVNLSRSPLRKGPAERGPVMSKNNASQAWVEKQVFTTGEAAEICKVSQQTIIRCFDNGRLNGFRVPGSRFRRIPRSELLRFMKANDIPKIGRAHV